MSVELPFAITFEVPQGWTLVDPESCGHPEAAYVAVRQENSGDAVAPNFAVNGFTARGGPVDVAALADSYLAKMQGQYPVAVLKRDVMAGDPASEAAQVLQIEFPVGDSSLTVNQIQILNAFPDAVDPTVTAVLQLMLTCPAALFAQAGPEFTRFVASIAAGQSEGSR
jgi:hypothetical protein